MKHKTLRIVNIILSIFLLLGIFHTNASCEDLNRRSQKSFSKAMKLEENKKWDEALLEYEKILKKNPDSVAVLERLTYITMSKGQEKEAELYARQAIKTGKKCPISLNVMGMLCERQQNLGRAKGYYLRSIADAPQYARAYNNLANVYMKEGSPEKAKENYLKAIELEPQTAVFHSNLAYIEEVLGNLQEAEKHYQRALELDPDSTAGTALQRLKTLREPLAEAMQKIADTINVFTLPEGVKLIMAQESEDGTGTAIYEYQNKQRFIVKELHNNSNFTDTIFAQLVMEHQAELLKMLQDVTQTKNMKMTGQGYLHLGKRQTLYISTESFMESLPIEGTFTILSKKMPERHILFCAIANKGLYNKKPTDDFLKSFARSFY